MMHQVFMVCLTLLLAVRGIECLDFCFDASMEGSRLNSTILKKVDVSSMMECVVSCVKEPCCRSINYRGKLPHDLASLCEMLHDVVDKTSAKLEKNRFFDYIYFNAPLKEYDSSCVTDKDPTQEFDLEFPSKDIKNYILLDNNVPGMSNVTLMFWVNIVNVEGKMAVLSYVVEESKTDLRVFVEKDEIIVVFRPNDELAFSIPPINDGYWHHVGVTWSLGQYSIYLDGALVYSGSSLGSGKVLRANGVFAIGQRLLSTNGEFYSKRSFSGKLSQLNMWDYDYISIAGVSMTSISQSCSNPVGNIINWSVLRDRASGMVVVKEQPRSCKSLRNNTEYDIIIANSTEDIRIKPSKNDLSLPAFTITLWEKRLYDYKKCIKYVGPAKILLSVCTDKDVFILDIDNPSGTQINREARVPTYRDKYWHHIATTWSSETGNWTIYLDGSLVSIMHDVHASEIKIPAGGQLSLTSSPALSRLNIWNYAIDGHALSLMANKGPTFENGNVFAWYGVKSKVVGGVSFEKTPSDLNNSRSRSVHQMNFPEASTENYAKIENVFFDNIEKFTACFWAKILTNSGIFTYSTTACDDEIAAFLYDDNRLELIINGDNISIGPTISTPESWHLYCMQWRSSDGFVSTYQDAIKLKVDSNVKKAGHVISPMGTVVLGQELDSYASGFSNDQAFKGSLAGLNFWTYLLNIDTIQGMAAGMINVNGDLLQWRDFMTQHVFGSVSIVERSEAEIPEYRVQALRDQWCKDNTVTETTDFTYARFVRCNQNDGYKWRCVTPMAMLKENMCYNISKGSIEYHTRDYILGIN